MMIFHHALTTVLLSSALGPRQQKVAESQIPLNVSALRAAQLCSRFDAVVIDIENVRGKTGFAISHGEILDALEIWGRIAGVDDGKLTLAVDHGHDASSYWIGDDAGYAIVFAGPHCKADDTIAIDLLPFFSNELSLSSIMVVTGDYELIQRCKHAVDTTQCRLEFLAPHALIADLEKVAEATPKAAPPEEVMIKEDDDSSPDDEPSGLVDEYELKIGSELLEVEALLRKRAGMSSKRRKKLRLKGSKLWQKLEGGKVLERIVDFLKHGRHSELLQQLSKFEQNTLLDKWEKEQRHRKQKERTADRVVLAEQLRLELEEKYNLEAADGDTALSGRAYVLRNLPKAKNKTNKTIETGTLRLVVVSDTHGFEEQLTDNNNGILPGGDVLLHLGDFAVDRSPDMNKRLEEFDLWLARQPHPTKIVLRGNHDPRNYQFSQSGATYLTRPEVKEIGDYTFSFVPYISGGLRRKKCLPKSCDVLVSHVPPRKILDRCLTGKYAGSQTILKGVQRMTANPPTLWLCGHIHEARGVVRKCVFCGNKETTVINCSSANAGIACRLDHGPVVVELGEEGWRDGNTKLKNKVKLVKMDGQYVFMNQRHASFFQRNGKEESDARQMLIAVDLGLRTGVSLFDDSGRLLRYGSFQFKCTEELQKGAADLLMDWEVEANNSPEEKPLRVTHLAIEGGDLPLIEAWRQAVNGEKAILYVKPEEWRADLLTTDEMLSGETSKIASKMIARQIVLDHGITGDIDEVEFQTDVAESILLGLHVSRRLGWGDIHDPVRRHCN